MKKYNIEFDSTMYPQLPVIFSEHKFLIMALWTAYKLLSRQNKIKIIRVYESDTKICLFEIRRKYALVQD